MFWIDKFYENMPHDEHHEHEYWFKERHAGLKDEKPVRIPPPMCPELLKAMNDW